MSYRLALALDSPSFSAAEWTRQVLAADDAGFDFVTFEDHFGAAGPDAVLVAARVAPLTRHVGLVPVATTTHTEPFHLSTALATLDHISGGRAGWQVRVSATAREAALLGRRAPLPVERLFAEAGDAVEVVRRLWDSWEDDAVIADVATGRYIDRDKLHYIDFAGEFFSVRGPSIVPRPPQGQPVVTARVHAPVADEFAARSADLVFVEPAGLAATVARIRAAESAVGRGGAPLLIFADVPVPAAGPPGALAELLAEAQAAGADGFRLRSDDLTQLTAEVLPRLAFEPARGTLRQRLGLGPAVNRYAREAPVG